VFRVERLSVRLAVAAVRDAAAAGLCFAEAVAAAVRTACSVASRLAP